MPTGDRPEPPTRATKLVYSGTFEEASWSNVMWLYLTGSGEITVPELNDLASACATPYIDNFSVLLSTDWSLDSVQVVLYGAGDDVLEGVSAGGSSATSTAPNLPASAAACITWQIAPHYRGGHPRTYLCGLNNLWLDGVTTIDASYRSSLTSAAIAFHGDLEAISGISTGIASVEHGILSFVRADEWRTPPVFYRIAGATVDSRLDTQRRRLGRDRA